jgi:hypothetical protein
MERQDLDALLIGALYGELTPAEEARLNAHLESHPSDRGALDELKSARAAVRESRIFDHQAEPPQAVSALLLQEAARRAPKRSLVEEKESWFARFTRVFIAHPAWAAATMLVLVVGVAGTLYVKKGDQFADQSISQHAASSQLEEERSAPLGGAPAPAAEMALEDPNAAFDVGLAEGRAGELDDLRGHAEAAKNEETALRRDGYVAAPAAEPTPTKKPAKGIGVSTSQPMPKEMQPARGATAKFKSEAAAADDAFGSGLAAGGAPGPARPRPATSSPPPPAQVARGDAESSSLRIATPTATADARPADKRQEDSSLLAWAKGEHARAVQLAQKDCRAAAKVAIGVSNRYADYYSQHMASDRALKQCMSYINAERDREAERDSKARAQKRTNAFEAESPAPAPRPASQ